MPTGIDCERGFVRVLFVDWAAWVGWNGCEDCIDRFSPLEVDLLDSNPFCGRGEV